MSQNTDITFPLTTYTRADFAALRAWVQRVPLERIERLYYVEDAPQLSGGLEKHLTRMRHDLIERAILANPRLADGLARARAGGALTSSILDILVKAAEAKPGTPTPNDPIAKWLRPGTAKPLQALGLQTLNELRNHIERFGPGWWRPVPRVGQLRARVIERWLGRQAGTAVDPSSQEVLPPTALSLTLTASPLPIERINALPHPLDGHDGRNRASQFCFLQARNDLEAIHSYLVKFKHQKHTLRAYTRELERLLLWCVLVRRTALSSLLVDDCEAYKEFLSAPSPALVGPRAARNSPRWRPFAGRLAPESQRQAVQIIRTAFAWLVNVRYLGGNPWIAVADPRVEQQILPMQIDRALPQKLWERTVVELNRACEAPQAAQLRCARVAILLMGDSGLRISEAATAQRARLRASTEESNLWLLEVLGKRNKWRLVPVSQRCYEAMSAHWEDIARQRPALLNESIGTILQPLARPRTKTAATRSSDPELGYSVGGASRLVTTALRTLADGDFSDHEAALLRNCSAHAFRHTFGTTSTASGMPLDVVQRILGHASLSTSSIYVQAERKRMERAAAALYN